MFQILSLIVLITAVFYMVSVRGKAIRGEAVDKLGGLEMLYVWIACFLSPVFSGAVFYYGWKKLLPHKAKQANAISLWAFLILIIIIIGVLYFISTSQ